MNNTNLIERLRSRLANYDSDLAATIAAKILPDRKAYGEDVSGITYDEISEAAALIEQQEAVIASLVEALTPFAIAADDGEQMINFGGYKMPHDDSFAGYEQRHGGYVQMTPLWGELRKARAAHEAAKFHLDRATP